MRKLNDDVETSRIRVLARQPPYVAIVSAGTKLRSMQRTARPLPEDYAFALFSTLATLTRRSVPPFRYVFV